MNYKNILEIIIDKEEETIKNNIEYIIMSELINKLKSSINDIKIINSIKEEEFDLLPSDLSKTIIKGIKYYLENNYQVSENEIKSKIEEIIKELEEKLKENNKKIEYLETKRKLLNENIENSYEERIEFIEENIKKKNIDYETGIKLLFQLTEEITSKKEKTDIESEEEIKTNSEEEKQELIDVLNKYGYNIEDFGRIKNKFLEYANPEYTDYVLNILSNKYKISSNDLKSNSKSIFKIIISSEKDTFDKVCTFVDENSCTMRKILSFPSFFAKQKRNYRPNTSIRKRTIDVIPRDIDTDLKVISGHRYFIRNIEIYKKYCQKDKISDKDLQTLTLYLGTPTEIIEKNIKILTKYGLIEKDKIPESTITALIGNNTEYIIDRYLELGLFDRYLMPQTDDEIKKNAPGLSYVRKTSSPFRFYKLKRAISMGENVFTGRGLRQELNNDETNTYRGIYINEDNKIVQTFPTTNEEIEELIEKLINMIPDARNEDYEYGNSIIELLYKEYSNSKSVDKSSLAKKIFTWLYEYQVFTPTKIFQRESRTGELLEEALKKDYQNFEETTEIDDEYIKILDANFKHNDIEYIITNPNFKGISLTISRYKVIRLVKLLIKDNLWIKENDSQEEIVNKILSIMLKDSIISLQEQIVLRHTIQVLFNKKEQSKQKRS